MFRRRVMKMRRVIGETRTKMMVKPIRMMIKMMMRMMMRKMMKKRGGGICM